MMVPALSYSLLHPVTSTAAPAACFALSNLLWSGVPASMASRGTPAIVAAAHAPALPTARPAAFRAVHPLDPVAGIRGFAAQAASVEATTHSPRSSKGATDEDQTPPESEAVLAGHTRKLGAKATAETYGSGYVAPHPSMAGGQHWDVLETALPKPAYDINYLQSIKPTHLPPKDLADRVGLFAVRLMRKSFDLVTGYGPRMSEAKWLQRMIFLETVAGVPGMVAGMLRHLHSLRTMRRDQGWIHCLLEEAENERMHLITFLEARKPGPLFRAMVLLAQGVFFNLYFLAYLLWPRACHAFVGYLEEEAVRTYTHALQDIDGGKLWPQVPAPEVACKYWGLAPGATMRDVILAVRADEACHSHVNHTLSSVLPHEPNPFAQGKSHLP